MLEFVTYINAQEELRTHSNLKATCFESLISNEIRWLQLLYSETELNFRSEQNINVWVPNFCLPNLVKLLCTLSSQHLKILFVQRYCSFQNKTLWSDNKNSKIFILIEKKIIFNSKKIIFQKKYVCITMDFFEFFSILRFFPKNICSYENMKNKLSSHGLLNGKSCNTTILKFILKSKTAGETFWHNLIAGFLIKPLISKMLMLIKFRQIFGKIFAQMKLSGHGLLNSKSFDTITILKFV